MINSNYFQSQYTKSSTALNNATLLAAAGVDARVLSQMQASFQPGNTGNSVTSSSVTGSVNKRNTESPVQHKKETAETQQQRQAAAKLALRKQLEKTLLQVTTTNKQTLCQSRNFYTGLNCQTQLVLT